MEATPSSDRRSAVAKIPRRLETGFLIVGLAVAYFMTGKLGLLLAVPPGYATAIFPSSGIALVALLIWGYRMWPGIWLGSCLMNLSTPSESGNVFLLFQSFAIPASIATGASFQAILGAYLIRRFIGFPTLLHNEREVFGFLGLGGLVGSLASATVGVTTLAVAGTVPWSNYPYSWGTWWIGDTIGVMIIAPLVLILLSPSENSPWRRRLSVVLPLSVTFILTIVLFFYASRWEQQRMELEFGRRADAVAEALHRKFDVYLTTLQAIDSFYQSSPVFTRESFHEFVNGQLARAPGIHALEWAPLIPHTKRAALERSIQRSGFTSFSIVEFDTTGRIMPAQLRHEYVPLLFVEPYHGNETALGFDLLSEHSRSEALSIARDSATPIATERVTLIQERGNQFGFVVYLPIYRHLAPHDTVEERRRNLTGFAIGVFRLGHFVSSALEKVDRTGIEFRLIDHASSQGKQTLLTSAALELSPHDGEAVEQESAKTPGRLELEIPLQVPGRQWTLHLVQTQEFFVATRTWHAWIVLLAGLLFTSFFGAFLLVMTGRTSLIETIVRERTDALSNANQALRQSEQKFRSVTESATDAIVATDRAGTIISWNRGGELVFGYIEEEIVGKPIELIIASRSHDKYTDATNRFSEAMGKPLEVEGVRKDGGEFPCELALSCWSTERGLFYSAIIRDITERKKADAEKALRQTEQSFHALTEAIPQIVWTAGPDGALDYYNQRWYDYTGLTFDQTKGWGWKPVLHPDDVNRCLDRWTEAVRTGGNYEIEYRFRRASDGAYRWHLGRGFPLCANDGHIIKWFGTCTDIHEQKLAEATIRETATRFRRIFESEMFGMVFWKYDGQIVDANDAFLKSVGYSREDLSAGLINWKRMTPPEYTNIDTEALKQLATTGSARAFEKEYIRKDGSRVPVLIGRATLDGVPGTGGIAYVFDVTDRKQAEADRARLLASEHAAQEASRLKSEFLANMSHEIRTPLNGVIGITSLLLDTPLNDEQRDQVDTIRRSGVALLAVINDILDVSKIESGKLELEVIDFDLRALVEDIDKTLSFAASRKGLRLATDVSSDVPLLLRGDPSRLHQILTNLVNNAIKFTAHGHVSLFIKKDSESAEGLGLYCEVTDTGIGIPPQALDRMFHAFSQADASTTRRFGGTGLGLSICKHLVTLMAGEIGVRSVPGAGSTFWFRVPLQKGQPLRTLTSAPSNTTTLQRMDHCRILVVEDNTVNQNIAVKMLGKLGIRADAVANGHEALDALGQIPYDLIVMDCQMPEMDGYETTAIIRKSDSLNRKGIPIVAMTANATKSDEERCLQAGMDDYMTKPVSLDSFKTVISRWLSKPAAKSAMETASPAEAYRAEALDLCDRPDPLLDHDIVASLRELNSDDEPEFFQTLIRNFLRDTAERVRIMRQTFTLGEVEQVRLDAHRLKGTCGNMGASSIGKLFGRLETAATSEDQESIAILLSEVEKDFRLVEIAFRTEVQR